MSFYMGIDPGQHGGIAIVSDEGYISVLKKMPETEKDLLELLDTIKTMYSTESGVLRTWIEKVSSMPDQGVASAFTFGRHYGGLCMALMAVGLGFREVTPASWMKYYGMRREKGEGKTAWKNRLKARAQQLYPEEKITLDTADSLLIAHAQMMMTKA